MVAVSVTAIVVGLFALAWYREKKIWNNGVCRETGNPWEHFDTDSQGGRMYKSGRHYCDISWPFIDK